MERDEKQCETCGGDLLRVRRSPTAKVLYLSVYKCSFCEVRTARARCFTFWLARRSQCPRCGNKRLDRMLERRGIEKLYLRPLVLAQSLLRARLYHCPDCDLQFSERREGKREALKSTAS